MPPSFVFNFITLLLLGPIPAMAVAMAGIIAEQFASLRRSHPVRRMLVNGATTRRPRSIDRLSHDERRDHIPGHRRAEWQRLPWPGEVVRCAAVRRGEPRRGARRGYRRRQLTQQNFVNLVEQAVHEAGLQPCEVRIEITETALMDSPGEGGGGPPPAARFRREDLSGRLRHGLFVSEPPAQAPGRGAV